MTNQKYPVGVTVTFLGLRMPVNCLAIPDYLRDRLRGMGITPRAKLLLRRDDLTHAVVYDPTGQQGVVTHFFPAVELWFDEVNQVTQLPCANDNGYFWLNKGKTYLIFEDELSLLSEGV